MRLFLEEASCTWATLFAQLISQFPTATWTCIIIFGTIFVVIVSIAIILKINPELAKNLFASYLERHCDQTLKDERDRAIEAHKSAMELVSSLTNTLELFHMSLDVAHDTVTRANRLRYNGARDQVISALMHLADWTQRIFGFLASDINKVTIWLPVNNQTLQVGVYNGMSPEAARTISLPIYPSLPTDDTFAAMAYRSGDLLFCSDTDKDHRFHQLKHSPSHPYKSLIAVPVLLEDKPVGVITIDSIFKATFDSKDSQQLAKLCASLAALLLGHDSCANLIARS